MRQHLEPVDLGGVHGSTGYRPEALPGGHQHVEGVGVGDEPGAEQRCGAPSGDRRTGWEQPPRGSLTPGAVRDRELGIGVHVSEDRPPCLAA
ncbi:hypothetical protein [Micromonospora sp. NPDC047134]|uniref:hypothetical protein n=1 Tax=Micromonospora sp. NPDC047134 TaxID=3154340 RepID=UPI0033D99BA4